MKLLNNLTQNKVFSYIFCFICLCALTISFIYKINLSNLTKAFELNQFLLNFNIYTKNGGAVSDLITHWEYIQVLRQNFPNLFSYEMAVDTKILNFPLHNIIFSQLYFLSDNLKNYLLYYFCFSLILPYIFYLCLLERFKEINKPLLIILSSIIYIFPVFQYSAIWGSSHISSLFFFLLGILFHIKFKISEFKKINYVILSIVFLAVASYIKQYYVFFFFFIFLEFFFRLNFKFFITISLFTILLGIPGLLFLLNNPLLFLGYKREITNFGSSVLISSSICFFYMLPFIIQYYLNNNFVKNFKIKNHIKYKSLILSLIIFFICISFFTYDGKIGGGSIYKLFYNILNQKILFFIFSFLGIYFLFFFTKNNIQSYFLSFLLICLFSTGYYIFQKYFEPMFLMIFLLYFEKIKIVKFLEKNNYILISYFLIYYLVSNYIYFFGV